MTTRVYILERIELTSVLGALVVNEPRTGREDVVDGPSAHTVVYARGDTPSFTKRADAEAFVTRHPGKAEIIAKCRRCSKRDVAYRGAIYCGAACSAQAEAGR